MENNTAITVNATEALMAEFTGGSTGSVEMMIGVGLVKDSDAVFFQYMGEEQQPVALTMPTSGKPLTRLANVTLAGLDIAEDVGEFKSTKLNIYLKSNQGRTIMLTSGLTTIWSQCLLNCISGLNYSENLQTPFNLDTWKGNSSMRPCFAGIRINGEKITDDVLYNKLADARADKDYKQTEKLLRNVVNLVKAALSTEDVEVAVDEAPAVDPQAAELF